MERFDVVIVGARVAGSPLATMLARRGLRVCLLDRARFPSDTASTHVIQARGVEVLDRLGVRASLLDAGAVELTGFTLVNDDVRIDADLGDDALREAFPLVVPPLCVRRVTLDRLLLDAAADAGVDVRTRTGATGLCTDGSGRVTGVQTGDGALAADLVVGADGRNSTVARLVGAEGYLTTAACRPFAWAYFEGVADREARLRIGRIGELAFIACPTDGGRYLAGAVPSAGTGTDGFMARFAAWPELAELLAGARRVGPIRVVPDARGYFRPATGPGWVLTGDAGHFKDPTPAQGIADALRHAERLAEIIGAGLGAGAVGGGTSQLDEELRRFWRWRDDDCYEMHWLAADMGTPGHPTPLVTELLRGISGDTDATVRLLRVLNRDLRPSELFTPRRVLTAIARTRPTRLPAVVREAAAAARQDLRRARQRRRVAHIAARWGAGAAWARRLNDPAGASSDDRPSAGHAARCGR